MRWSDISVFELDRKALVLSRVLAASAAVFLVALTATLLPPTGVGRDPRPQSAAPACALPLIHQARALGDRPARCRHLACA